MTNEFDKLYESTLSSINEKKLCSRGKAAAKAKFDVYPSAYANAYASKVCSGKVKDHRGKKRRDWKKKNESVDEGLKDWFKQKWVNIGARKKGGKYQPCGRKDADTGKYPKCVPAKKAYSMSKSDKRSAVSRKRKAEKKGRSGKSPNYVKTEKSIHDPVRPGILKRQIKGKITCSKARTLKGKQKNKSNNTAKAAQRFLNYHC